MTDERSVKRIRPDVEDFMFHHDYKRARQAHQILSHHVVAVGDHDPEVRHPRMTMGREWLDQYAPRPPKPICSFCNLAEVHAPGCPVIEHSKFAPSDRKRWLDCPGVRPKVRTSHHRNAEEAARLQGILDARKNA